MAKLVILSVNGEFEQGFAVRVEIKDDYKLSVLAGDKGTLPPAPHLCKQLHYWNQTYKEVTSSLSTLALRRRAAFTHKEDADRAFCQATGDLIKSLNEWLNSSEFRPVESALRDRLKPNEEVRVLLETDNLDLRKLPWQEWKLLRDFPLAEIALSSPKFKGVKPLTYSVSKSKAKILVILGDEAKIDSEAGEIKKLAQTRNAEVRWLQQPQPEELDEPLWKERWDIIFYAGHGATTEEGKIGKIKINAQDWLTVSDIRHHLRKAIDNGLRLAIFNACDGLGLAYQLAEGEDLHLPQIIVMRDLLPVAVAPRFLQFFLEAFTQKKSLYSSVGEARRRLKILEKDFPGASWLPIICQNGAETPLSWQELQPLPPCPYRGLQAFREVDKELFFGRDRLTSELTKKVRTSPLVAVIGASGSGKSSLVFAGLIPQLRTEENYLIASMRPGKRPFNALAEALLGWQDGGDSSSQIIRKGQKLKESKQALQEAIASALQNNVGWVEPSDQTQHRQTVKPSETQQNKTVEPGKIQQPQHHLGLILIIDQFEELYTLCGDETERECLLDSLLYAVKNGPGFKLVITLRADFYRDAISHHAFAKTLETGVFNVSSMMPQELHQAIALPAKNCGVTLEGGLTERILEDVGKKPETPGDGFEEKPKPDKLPLLEFALQQLWEQAKQQGTRQLTHQVYDEIGGVENALGQYAEAVYAGKLQVEEQLRLERVFLELVRPGERTGTEDTRRLATRGEMGDNWDLATRLNEEDVRLVVIGYDRGTGEETVEVVHEALIAGWGRLKGWIDGDRAFLTWRERLRVGMRQWQASEEDEGALLRGALLVEAEGFLRGRSQDIGKLERVFIEKGLELRERERQEKEERLQRELEQERKARRAAQTRTGVAVVAAAVVSVLAFIANGMRLQAELRESVAVVKSRLPYTPLEGLVLAISTTGKSYSFWNQLFLNKDVFDSIQSSLLSAVQIAKEENRFLGHEDAVISVTFSPNRKYIVSGSVDGTLRLWNLQGEPIGKPWHGHENGVTSVAFSPDGKSIVSSSVDGILRLWNLQGKLINQPWGGHEAGGVNSVAFSPNGQYIVSGSVDGTLRLWNLQGEPIGAPWRGEYIGKPLRGYNIGGVNSVTFSPNGQLVVSGGWDGTLRLWNLRGEPISQPWRGHQGGVYSVAFSPNGQLVVSSGWDGTLRLWNLQGKPIGAPWGDENVINSVAFSPDGKFIVSGGKDNTLRLWNLKGELISEPWRGHQEGVTSVAFSSDGKYIISGSRDNTLRLWNLQEEPIGESWRGYEKGVISVAFSPDRKYIVSGRENGTLRLQNIKEKLLSKLWHGHENGVTSVAFSPDGKHIVSGSLDNTLRLWNLQGEPLSEPWNGHESWVTSIAFSPNGKHIVSASNDGTLRLSDLQGQTLGKPWRGHEGVVTSVAFSPDGQHIVSGSLDKTLRLWNLQGEPIGKPWRGHEDIVYSVAFSPDGKSIVSSSRDKTLRLWNLQGEPLGEPWNGHEDVVNTVAFSLDGQYIVSGAEDGTLRLWNSQGQPLGEPWQGHKNFVISVVFSPDGQSIVSGSKDGTLRLWQIGNWETWLEIGCNRLRHHPVLKEPQTPEAKQARKTCQRYVW